MKIDLKALEEKKERNRKERLEFLEMYVKWLKKTPNEIWSKQHSGFIDSGMRKQRKIKSLA